MLQIAPPITYKNNHISQQSMEQSAMSSLGYTAVVHSAAYPEDRYAMPEPFSSEQLVTYAIRIQKYKSELAAFNFNGH